MDTFTSLLQQGNAWWFIPSAILLGILHGLEPGHSKTMMAAFIIAIKGTVRQAAMLGVAATLSHTAVVWLIALGGIFLSQRFTAQSVEPWLQLISAGVILATACWMFLRTWRGERGWLEQHHHHAHDHQQYHSLASDAGRLRLAIQDEAQGAYFQIRAEMGELQPADEIRLLVTREARRVEPYTFRACADYYQSVEAIPEPHCFDVRLLLGPRGAQQSLRCAFHEAQDHYHDAGDEAYQDAHAKAHADAIQRRFAGQRSVSNGQIILFGLTGGLIPCPAAITILLICIQLKAIALGATMVLCFSLGLAITLVAVGVAAAVSVRQASRRWPGFDTLAAKAPYASCVLIGAVGIYMGLHGYWGLVG
ncbi:nickel/cobalt efflux transporter [Edwardsiella piscicida]|uniref:nickel/cobalt efflux transporter n=1 Tax=Edwardsiella piscicida TaxID=1263550 RepID=UPI00370D770C